MISLERPRHYLFAMLLLVLIAAVAQAERPTRKQVQAYAMLCTNAKVQADFIRKFGTDFSGLDLAGINFRGPHAVSLETNLRGADFSNSNLTGAKFGAAELHGANFTSANLTNTTFTTGTLIGANLTNATLTGSGFHTCNMQGITAENTDWTTSDLTGSRLDGAELSGCKFTALTKGRGNWGNNFSGSKLVGTEFRNLSMQHADFSSADLSGADFTAANLEQADFSDANLTDAVFDGASVGAAIFANSQGLSDQQRDELTGQAKRWHFDTTNNVKWFLDSPVFPLSLMLVIPLLILGYRAFTRRKTDATNGEEIADGQFNLSTLLWAVLAFGVYFGVGSWSLFGLYWLTMNVAFFVVAERIVFCARQRKVALAVLAFAIGYAMLNVLCFVAAVATDPFLVINLGFMVASTLVGPILAIAFVVFMGGWQTTSGGSFPWRIIAAAIVLQMGIALANAWIFVAAMASV
ncbi:MAG: hypothetical protein ACI9HK_000229 [Pirellulaceae bacterium]